MDRILSLRCFLQFCDVNLLHLHHGGHGLGVLDELRQVDGDDLPGEAEAVLEPAALYRRAAFDELVVVVIDIGLRVAADDEGEGLVEGVVRAAVDGRHGESVESESDGERLGAAAAEVGREVFRQHLGVGEDGDVEGNGLLGAGVEPEEGRDARISLKDTHEGAPWEGSITRRAGLKSTTKDCGMEGADSHLSRKGGGEGGAPGPSPPCRKRSDKGGASPVS